MAKNKLSDERMDRGVPIKERYERFCVRLVETGNPLHAFRTSFALDKRHVAEWVHDQARELMNDPEIAQRVQEIRDAAAQQLLIDVRGLMQDYYDIVTADPNELVSYVRENCRHCRGVGYAYQWRDAEEFATACEAAARSNAKIKDQSLHAELPTCDGGFGFDATRDPIAECPHCYGEGIGRSVIHDTRRLSPRARKLYLGVKEGASGIEVKMADKDKAREMLGKMLGAFKDGIPVIPVQAVPLEAEKPLTLDAANRSYLKLIQGGKS